MKVYNLLKISILIALVAMATLQAEEASDFYFSYSTSRVSVDIKDGIIYHHTFKEKFDNPVSATPSSTEKISRRAPLSESNKYKLIKSIQDNKFFKLKKSYGAPKKERYYPYTLEIQIGKQRNKVIHRSNPSYDSSPPEFTNIIKDLNSIIDSIDVWD
jgi:hypothetical protein